MASTNHGSCVRELAPDSSGVSVVLIDHPPVNAFNDAVKEGLQSAVRAVHDNPSARAMVVASARKGVFMAGADITNIRAIQQRRRTDRFGADRDIDTLLTEANAVLNAIEASSKPAVAAIDGIAFGGGCELAMACHARVATKASRLGLPELSLGIIPGFGGCQRLPRLVGVQAAVQATLSGKPFKAAKALEIGLVDVVVDGDALAAATKLAAALAAPGGAPLRRSLEYSEKLGVGTPEFINDARVMVRQNRKMRGLPQFNAYLDAVEAGVLHGGHAGVRKEISIMKRLIVSPTAQGLVHFFLASKETNKVPGVTAGANKPRVPKDGGVKTVAVLGGGTMGSGIAVLSLMFGYRVILKEINDKALEAGVGRVEKTLARTFKKRRMTPDAAKEVRSRLTPQTTYDGFDGVDFVIEAAVENLKIKQIIIRELEEVCGPNTIIGTNTSTIDIAVIASACQKAETRSRVVGAHFFSPAHVMPLLEIIRTDETSAETLARVLAYSGRTKKTPVVVGNCVGFAANRAFFPYGQAAALLMDSGVSPYDIDRALLKFGMPMGALEMADLSGIDIAAAVNGTFSAAYGERCYKSTIVKRLVDAGRLGQKTGAGYYDYSSGRRTPDPKGIRAALEGARADAGLPKAPRLTDEEIVEICLFPVANEAFRIVADGVVLRESDIDVCSVYGYGFPAPRGGVINWARSRSLSYVAGRLATLANTFADGAARSFFAPCDYLLEQARKQE